MIVNQMVTGRGKLNCLGHTLHAVYLFLKVIRGYQREIISG